MNNFVVLIVFGLVVFALVWNKNIQNLLPVAGLLRDLTLGFFKELSNYRKYRNWPGSTFESALKIGVARALFQSLGMIPVEITKLKICVREAAMKVNDSFRRQVGIPSRPAALPTGLSFTSLRSPSMVINWSSKVLSQDSTKSRKLTRGGFILAAKLGPTSVKCLLKAFMGVSYHRVPNNNVWRWSKVFFVIIRY